nr:hypothetical protein [Natronosalvus caseinilyticus]
MRVPVAVIPAAKRNHSESQSPMTPQGVETESPSSGTTTSESGRIIVTP